MMLWKIKLIFLFQGCILSFQPLIFRGIPSLELNQSAMDPGYDDESVAGALTEGNQFFQQKDFSPALDGIFCPDFWVVPLGWGPLNHQPYI